MFATTLYTLSLAVVFCIQRKFFYPTMKKLSSGMLFSIMQNIFAILSASLSFTLLQAQTYYPDASLRLHPVWSRVADVNGEFGSIESAEFSPDGRYIVSGSKFDNSIIMWRTSDGTELWRQYAAQEVERVGWSADGKWVASCSEDHLVQIWDAKTGQLFKNLPHKDGIDALIWSNTGSLLVTGEEQTFSEVNGEKRVHGIVRVFQMPEGKVLFERDHGGTINEVKYTQDGKYLLTSGHNAVKVWKADDMSLVQAFKSPTYYNYVTAEFSPDGKYIAAGGDKGWLFIWDWQAGKLIKEFNYTGRKIESVAWHPNGEYLLSSGHGPYITIYRTRDILSEMKEIPAAAQVFANDGMEYIDFSANGAYLVSAHQDGIIRLWVWMSENPNLNAERHRWVSEQQAKMNEGKN